MTQNFELFKKEKKKKTSGPFLSNQQIPNT